MRNREPQWKRILDYMQNHECITSAIAWDVLRITSLHRRLTDLRRNGYRYSKKRVDPPNRPHHFEYRLSG